MQDLVEAAKSIQDFCDKNQWKFCFIGGLAVQHWGETRLTKDVDLTLITGFGDESKFIEKLLKQYQSRVNEAGAFALKNRVLLLKTSNNIGIDISLGALPFEEQIVDRAKLVPIFDDIALKLCTSEDLIVLKAFAAREIDWHDIQGILIRQGKDSLDWEYIFTNVTMLSEAKEDPGILRRLTKMKQTIG